MSFAPLPLRKLSSWSLLSLPALAGMSSFACSQSATDSTPSTGGTLTGGVGASASGGTAPGGASGGLQNTGGVVASGGAASGGAATGGTGASGGVPSGGTGAAGSGGASGGAAATGGGGASGGTAGSGGGGATELVQPIMRSANSYVLEFGDRLFEVDPTRGARIVSFSYADSNLLSPVQLLDNNFWGGGSTLWLSPQTWDWPPAPAIDSDPYTVTLDGDAIVVSGQPATFDGNAMSLSKRFSANLDTGGIDITYTMNNGGPGAAKHELWEVSRHPRGGFTFWPSSSAPSGWEFTPVTLDGILYWDDTQGGDDVKIFAEGTEGWMAHVEGTLLYVKSWADVQPPHAPDQAEVEVYLGTEYVELEVHGPYEQNLASGASATFDMHWYVTPIPPGTDISPGSAALLDLVHTLVP